LKSTRNQLLAEENALGDRVFLQTPKGASTLPVVPSWNGEGVLFRQTQMDCNRLLSSFKTPETPPFTPTLLLVS
jgi:hypothetical protein